MDRILRSSLPCLVMSVSLLTCTSSAGDKASEPLSRPSAEPAGVTLVLAATHASNGCCRILTVNPGRADATVVCTLVALDPAGRLVYSGVIPPKLPGHLRSSGFEAPQGRHGHGVFRLPIDLALDSYTAPCRPAAWHGGAPIYRSSGAEHVLITFIRASIRSTLGRFFLSLCHRLRLGPGHDSTRRRAQADTDKLLLGDIDNPYSSTQFGHSREHLG
jgi:hypothetical protein